MTDWTPVTIDGDKDYEFTYRFWKHDFRGSRIIFCEDITVCCPGNADHQDFALTEFDERFDVISSCSFRLVKVEECE